MMYNFKCELLFLNEKITGYTKIHNITQNLYWKKVQLLSSIDMRAINFCVTFYKLYRLKERHALVFLCHS